jgi:hypothetical protein
MASLAEIGVENRLRVGDGPIKAIRNSAGTCGFVWSWARTTRKLGRPPTQVEFAEEWKVTDRTVRRELTRFRETFPGVDLDVMCAWLNDNAAAQIVSRAGAVSLPAAAGWRFA